MDATTPLPPPGATRPAAARLRLREPVRKGPKPDPVADRADRRAPGDRSRREAGRGPGNRG